MSARNPYGQSRNNVWGRQNQNLQARNTRERQQQANNNRNQHIEDIFTIIVNANRYDCKKLAVTSSEVIREFIKNNPDSKEYNFEFTGSIDNFNIICDFFNFKPIKITKKNIDSIRPIAETLKISTILTKIENFTESFESKIQQITPMEEVFNWLYQIQKLTVNSVKKSILESNWSQSEDNVKELASFILQVVRSGYQLQPYLVELIISLNESSNDKNKLNILQPFIINQMLNFFYKNQFYSCFTCILVQKGILSIDNVIQRFITLRENAEHGIQNNKNSWGSTWGTKPNTNSINISELVNILNWFYTELLENNLIDEKLKLTYKKNFIPNEENITIYKKMRESFEPENNILKALYNDDVDTLQSIVSKGNFDINNFIPSFELIDLYIFHNCKPRSLIDYSSLYGSIKCFKYLLLNHAQIDNITIGYAIIGGNVEIIRTIDQQFEADNYDFSFTQIYK